MKKHIKKQLKKLTSQNEQWDLNPDLEDPVITLRGIQKLLKEKTIPSSTNVLKTPHGYIPF